MAARQAIEIVMPRMGLTMEEGSVVAWLKQPGQAVHAGEPLLEIETDKASVEIEAPGDGVLAGPLLPVGEVVPVGTVIGRLEPEAVPVNLPSAAAPAGKVRASPAARRLARQAGVDLGALHGSGPHGRVVAWNVQAAAQPQAGKPAATPLARRMAAESGVDLRNVRGSGPGGQIRREDVAAVVEGGSSALPRAPAPTTATATPAEIPPAPTPPPAATPALPGSLTPVSRGQRLMAERMAASFSSAPHFYLHVETDARPLLALREQLLPIFDKRHGLRLTVTDLLVKFCALALQRHPALRAQWQSGGLFQPEGIHIGVASDTPNGLVVPVIHDCERLGLAEIARRRVALVEKARAGKLAPADLELGVFTLTNLGTFNVDFFDAILNPPQAAILAVGRIKERPLAQAGQVIAAPTLALSLSLDHRVVDGATGARFLGDLVELLETPALALE